MTRRIQHLVTALGLVAGLAACGPAPQNGNPDGSTPEVDAEDVPVIDAQPAPDAFGPDLGVACETSADCPDGFCIAGPDGKVCTYGCTTGCPRDYSCRVAEVDGELVSVCLPVVVQVCAPCTDDGQCAGGACIELEDGSYCLRSCFEGACPDGYACEDDPTGVHPGGFCIPDTGGCSCTADNAGQQRTCENTNAEGTCLGVETCDPAVGWVGCNAPSASTEICDGLDNDCDFLIDDGVSGGVTCTNDVPGIGSCPGVTLCTGAGDRRDLQLRRRRLQRGRRRGLPDAGRRVQRR
jgi:hypothetical protein